MTIHCMNLHKWTKPFFARSVNAHVVTCSRCGRSRKATPEELQDSAPKVQDSSDFSLPTSAEDN